jgi:hypothetical protein
MSLLVPLFQHGMALQDIRFEYFDAVFSEAYQRYRQGEVQIIFENFPASGTGERSLLSKLKEWCQICNSRAELSYSS